MAFPYNQSIQSIPVDDRIIVERHYIPPNLYREIYFGYPSQPQIYYQPSYQPSYQQSYQQSYQPVPQQQPIPATNVASNIYSPPHTINQSPEVRLGNIPTIYNTRNLPSELFQTRDNQQSRMGVSPLDQSNIGFPVQNRRRGNRIDGNILNEAPVEIRNLINGLLNTNTPFELQVSAVPAELIINRNAGGDANNHPLSLSNINIVSTVSRFDSLETNIDTCSICQQSLNNTDIVRKLNNCTHVFHLSCIDTWLSERNTCPSCRHSLINDLNNQQPNTTSNSSNTVNNNSESTNDEDDIYDEDEDDDEEGNEDEDDDEDNSTYSENCECNCCDCVNDTKTEYYSDDCDDGDADDVAEPETQQSSNPSNGSPNIRIFTNLSQGLGDIRNDINNLINSGTPIINSLINGSIVGSSNISPILNSTELNNNVNTIFNNISPLINAFSDLMNNSNNSNSSSFVFRHY